MARRHAREAAVKWLFEHDLARTDPADLVGRPEPGLDAESRAFAKQLFFGVLEHQAALDERLGRIAVDWRVERMNTVDRAVLRVGLYELTALDTPTEVILSEAVELAERYSTPEAKRFINGVLGEAAYQVRHHVRQ
jgi:N utilization substance protein B